MTDGLSRVIGARSERPRPNARAAYTALSQPDAKAKIDRHKKFYDNGHMTP